MLANYTASLSELKIYREIFIKMSIVVQDVGKHALLKESLELLVVQVRT